MDWVELPDGTIIKYPQGVDETSLSQKKDFPLRTVLTKWHGQKYYYCYQPPKEGVKDANDQLGSEDS